MACRFTLSSLRRLLRSYVESDRGNISLILGLSILPLVLCAGVAVDYERMLNAKTSLQAALDTAALYATNYSMSNTGSSNAKLTTISQPYVTTDFDDTGDATVTNYAAVDNGTTVTVTATLTVNNHFMAMAGIASESFTETSVVTKSGINLEVALVLDNTNSMNEINSQTGNTAIGDLKTAASQFVSTVMPATQGTYYTKIAVVPYNNSVNMGSTAMAAAARGAVPSGTSTTPGSTNYTFSTNSAITANMAMSYYGQSCNNSGNSVCQRTMAVTNCVSERTGVAAYTDASMSSNPVGLSYLPSGNPCSVTPVVPLSTSASTLNTAISSMVAANSTAGQVGIAWGWYTLSPNVGIWSGSSVPSSYANLTTTNAATKVRKVMVLMTDAEYNSAMCNGVITGNDTVNGSPGYPYYSSVVGSGSPADHIGCAPTNGDVYTQSNAMCTAIKNAGIEIFVITFQLDTSYPQRVALTQNCATDSAHLINADTTSLSAAFQSLATQILAMRISQ